MLPFGVTIPATVLQRSEIPEGLRNYSVYSGLKKEVLDESFYGVLLKGVAFSVKREVGE